LAERFTAIQIVSNGLPPFLIVVSNTDRNMANISQPRSERKFPETFCLTLIFRIARSEPLSQCLDNGSYPNLFIIPTYIITDRYRMCS